MSATKKTTTKTQAKKAPVTKKKASPAAKDAQKGRAGASIRQAQKNVEKTAKKAARENARNDATRSATKKKFASEPPTKSTSELMPVVAFATIDAWTAWLDTHHASARGVWMKLAKKSSGERSITYPEALDVALAYGWIDGQKGAHDEAWWVQKFTPRGAKSIWSTINRGKALALIEAGKMTKAGLAEVERAQKDGRWAAAYEPQSKATVPEDLSAALDADPRAKAFFATLEARNRYAILWRVHTAKTAETRGKRIAKFVEMLARHEKIHP